MNFSKIQGPFKTNIITNDDGKVIGKIRRISQYPNHYFILTSYTNHVWISEGIVKGQETKTCNFAKRKDARAEAVRVL